MPAKIKVSLGWQIVFMFIPIVNFWAFYRIQKLRRFVAFVGIPALIIEILLVMPFFMYDELPYSEFLIDRPQIEQQDLPSYMTSNRTRSWKNKFDVSNISGYLRSRGCRSLHLLCDYLVPKME